MQVSARLVSGRRRNGIAGVIAAALIFGMIFTAGIGYYVYENQVYILNSQAVVNKDAANLQASQERLGLVVSEVHHGQNNDSLSLAVYNVGGVSATMTAVFVTASPAVTGKMLSKYAGSPYLVGEPALNVTLPLSFAVGASTKATGHNIMISSAAYNYAGATVYVNVLTLLGNVFTVQYPPPPATTSIVTTGSTATTSTTTTTTVTASTASTISHWTTLTTSSGSVQGFVVGTNSMIVSMEACPGSSPFGTSCVVAPAVYQGQEVILKVGVTNYAAADMTTHVVFQAVGTNGASVTVSSPAPCTGGKTANYTIPADTGTPTTYTFTCTFSANTGSTGGTVTFIGYAVGSYTGPLGVIAITSAEASSNMLQLGNPASGITGPWALNYYSYNYASAEHTTFSDAATMSASGNHEVIFQVKVTNTANASMTVLKYSYLQFFRTQQEMDYYLITPVTTYTTSISAYNCVSNAPSAPSGSSCAVGVVAVGGTTTLSFAACSPGTAYWLWYRTGGGLTSSDPGYSTCNPNTNGFNAPEGVVGLAVVVYSVYNSNSAKWYTFSQTLPFQGSYISP